MPGFGGDLREVADELIEEFGDGRTATLRRYVSSGPVSAGKRTRSLAETIPEALVVVVDENILQLDTWSHGDRTLLISASGFASERLDGDWTLEEQGDQEREIGPIAPVRPGTDTVYYSAVIRRGAGKRASGFIPVT